MLDGFFLYTLESLVLYTLQLFRITMILEGKSF